MSPNYCNTLPHAIFQVQNLWSTWINKTSKLGNEVCSTKFIRTTQKVCVFQVLWTVQEACNTEMPACYAPSYLPDFWLLQYACAVLSLLLQSRTQNILLPPYAAGWLKFQYCNCMACNFVFNRMRLVESKLSHLHQVEAGRQWCTYVPYFCMLNATEQSDKPFSTLSSLANRPSWCSVCFYVCRCGVLWGSLWRENFLLNCC